MNASGKRFNQTKVGQIACFLICLMLMLVVPIWHDHKIIGLPIEKGDKDVAATLTNLPDGTIIVNTTELGRDITGYGGPTPIEMEIKDGVILKVKALPNQETPEFFGAVRNSDLLESYNGLTPSEAMEVPLDGVSGATFTSNAIIGNMKAGAAYVSDVALSDKLNTGEREPLSLKFYITIIIILAGGTLPFFIKDRRYRTLQLVMNVLLLGFWGGTFISYSLMTSYLANGITKVMLIPTALMLVAAFIYPMFGKKNYYCAWMCPYGSLQELLGKCCRYKFKMSPSLLKGLNYFRNLLWFVLMWLLWTGLWFEWMGYEPFAAFFFHDASAVVLAIAGGFLLLSLFVQRPYCRFVCPTGSLFKFAEGSF